MKYVRLAIDFSDQFIHPVHQRIVEHDGLARDRLLYGTRTTGPDTFLFAVEGDRQLYEQALEDVPEISFYELSNPDTTSSPGTFYAYIEQEPITPDEQLFAVFERTGVIVVPPVDFRSDGTARMTVVGRAERLQTTIDHLPEEMGVTIARVGNYERLRGGFGPALTDRQYDALTVANDCGYFDVPRTASIDDVAKRLDCATGTASEHLRKAQRELTEWLVNTSWR